MASINSDIFSKEIKSNGFRELSVSDETEQFDMGEPNDTVQPPPMPQPPVMKQISVAEIQKARQQYSQGTAKLSSGAKQRIALLANIGRLTKEVKIQDISFSIQTLKSRELQEAIKAAAKYDGTVEVGFETRKHFLARSIFKIGPNDIELVLGDDSIEARLAMIEELDESLISHLYNEYTKLSKQASDNFSIKSKEDAEEVLEDIKKS